MKAIIELIGALIGFAILGVLWIGVPLGCLWGFVALVKYFWTIS
jgi:hypothetical protein